MSFGNKKNSNESIQNGEVSNFSGRDIPKSWLRIKIKKTISEKRLSFIVGFVYAAFFLILIRMGYLMFSGLILNNVNVKSVMGKQDFSRPDIVDRNGEVLAINLPTFDLYAEAKNIISPEGSARALIKILPQLKYDDVLNKLKSGKSFVYLARKISPTEKEKVLLIGEAGFSFTETDYRFYTQGNLFSHLIGNINIDNKGISGIEKYIDDKGITGVLKLSVDLYVQEAIRRNLIYATKEYGAKTASGVLMSVKTGEVLGMVSLPDFHNNDALKVISNPVYNNHITLDVYEIGSVMKIFNTALAIENRYPNDKIFDISKPFIIGNFKIKDSHPKKWKINMSEAFIYSSNIASATIAQELGSEKQVAFFKKLKFFNRLRFELPELGFPIFPKKWNDVINATAAYGYGISITLLHTLTAVNAIINDGMYVEPTIIKYDENSLLKSYQVVSPETSDAVKMLMRLVITDGTGYMANLKSIKTGGKTGTSYKFIDGSYNEKKIRTFFVSVFPIDNPKYTMIVMLDEANNNGCISSGCTTVPISAKIIEDIAPLLNINFK